MANGYTVYESNSSLKLGFKIWPKMFRDTFQSRQLIWRLFSRNLIAKNKQAVLGVLWLVIIPFIAIGTFAFLNRAGILNIDETDVPYPLFALIGLTIWQLFSVGLQAGCESLVASSSLIAKVNFPKEVLVFASIAQSIFEFTVKFGFVIFLFIVYGYQPPWTIILFPLAVLPLLFLALGFSFILSLVNGVLRDTGNMLSLVLTFWMFLTPVLYPITQTSDKYPFFKWNSMTPLINGPRDLIVYGKMTEPFSYGVVTFVSILFFLIAWRFFYIAVEKIPERL